MDSKARVKNMEHYESREYGLGLGQPDGELAEGPNQLSSPPQASVCCNHVQVHYL